ncbi:fibronectin type III domain-containing protein [Pseudomonas sp. PB3P13]
MSEHQPETGFSDVTSIGPPGAIVAKPLSPNSISLSWQYDLAGQKNDTRLEWWSGGERVGGFDVLNASRIYEMTELTPNTPYRIYAFGLRGDEVSSYSRDTSATTLPASNIPQSPTHLVATPSAREMDLSFTGSANASSYKISYGLAPSGPVLNTEVWTTTAHFIGELHSGTNYYFDVRATNNFGDSPPSRVIKQTLAVPAKPTHLSVTAGVSTLMPQWTASPGASDYVIRYGVEPPAGTPACVATTLLKETLTGLTKNTLYFVEVSARNANGESLPAQITLKTLDGPPVPTKPGNLMKTLEFDSARLHWTADIGRQNFAVAYGFADQHPQTIASHVTEHRTYLLADLLPLARYFVEVRAFNESGFSDPASDRFTIGPDETYPRDLKVQGRTFDQAWVTWKRPLDYSHLRDYEVSCPGLETVHTTELEIIVTGLKPEQEYVFKVQPRRTDGKRPAASASISVMTHDRVPPARPRTLRLTPRGDGVELSWAPSEDNVGVTGHEVRRNGGAWVPATGTTHFFPGVPDANAETIEVRGKDAAGNRSVPTLHGKKIFQ